MAEASTCYYPDGSISLRDTPCHSPSTSDGASACCGESDTCLSNNLCFSQSEVISRGSCTDETWTSPRCSQYCQDVNPTGGVVIYLADYTTSRFCCSKGNPFNNTCLAGTQGSSTPFKIESGLVIFNRTSGSTSPNDTIDATVTVTTTATATATASASNLPSNYIPMSLSSRREAAIGVGTSIPLGLALFVLLGLLWRLRKEKQSLKKDIETWEGKHVDLMEKMTVDHRGSRTQSPHLLDSCDSWNPNGLHDQAHHLHQLEGWRPGEVDGTQVYEMENKK